MPKSDPASPTLVLYVNFAKGYPLIPWHKLEISFSLGDSGVKVRDYVGGVGMTLAQGLTKIQ